MFAKPCVFVKQSPGPFHCGFSHRCEEASLLPKLQDHFAEFLGRDSLERLRMLSLTTCVGLRYGLSNGKRLAGFLGSLIRATMAAPRRAWPTINFQLERRTSLPLQYLRSSTGTSVRPRAFHYSVTALTPYSGTGILTRWPSQPRFRSLLRSRLTLNRLALFRKPGSCGGRVSRPPYRYSCLHLLF